MGNEMGVPAKRFTMATSSSKRQRGVSRVQNLNVSNRERKGFLEYATYRYSNQNNFGLHFKF